MGTAPDETTQKFCGGAVPFAPLGSAGGGSTASGAALSGMTGAVPRYSAPRRAGTQAGAMAQTVRDAPADAVAAGRVSLAAKKAALARELGLGGDFPTVAAGAADILGIDLGPEGKKATEIIDECYHKLFE